MNAQRITGMYEMINGINYFIPYPLPPHNPPFTINEEITNLYGAAMNQLGQLNEITNRLPNQKRFIKAYVIKEALLSSAIEGIHTTLYDVFTQPLSGANLNKETQLVLNYTKALETACSMVKKDGLPIASRVILKAHKELMHLENDANKATPGHYRQLPVRVGNLIPTYAAKIPDLMGQLAQFINKDNALPPLIKAGLAHVQFETIHPFLDGNGRIGRLLIVLMLVDSNLLSTPIIYPSYYFKKHHHEYYLRLDRVRTHGDFEEWIIYYLKAILESSSDAYKRTKDIENLEQNIKQIIHSNKAFHKIKELAENALAILFQFPIIGITELSVHLNKSYNTTNNLIKQFIETGILIANISQSQRNKTYLFDAYLRVLEKEY
jgi:Fic family protein